MIELYVLFTLSVIGYILNKNSIHVKQNQMKTSINKGEVPSMRNIYESNHSARVEDKIQQRAEKVYDKSLNPKITGVISKDYNLIKSQLTGEYINEKDFHSENAVPYYGGSIKQNMNDDTNRVILEKYTGVSDIPKRKCEVESFNDMKQNMSNINGMKNKDDIYKERMVTPTIRNNDFPIPQVHVGRGLNQGFDSKPTGGFHQFEAQNLAKKRCVDELRPKLNPNTNTAIGMVDRGKETFEARTVDGMKPTKRAELEEIAKNRPDTWYEQTPDMWLKTSAANLKPKKHGELNVKDTNRITTSKYNLGTAYASMHQARKADPQVKLSNRRQFLKSEIGIATLGRMGLGPKNDHGKSKILVYKNERDVTSTRVYQGNITSLIKSVIAPIQDIIKITKKQHDVDNARHFGNMQASHKKATVYDPNDTARGTIKETTVHESVMGNLKGREALTIYDPNDPARTTLKETTVHETALGNLKGREALTTYDPNDPARTTVKETTVHETALGNLKGREALTTYDPNDPARTTLKETTVHETVLGNLKGREQLTIYDPNDIARTTIKETALHDEVGTSQITGPKQLYVYDPEEIAKKTLRETLKREAYETNLSAHFYKGKVYDPEDVARTTTKQTMIDKERLFGNVNTIEGGGGYETNEHDAKNTHKQFLSDIDYYGGVRDDQGKGYITNEFDAKNTHKQFLSDHEYYGVMESSDKKQKSYDDMYNAEIDANKEEVLVGREPTQTSSKKFNSKVHLARLKKQVLKPDGGGGTIHKISNAIPSKEQDSVTRIKNNLEENYRFDITLFDAIKNNPYVHDINAR